MGGDTEGRTEPPSEESREAGTGGRGGANLLGASLPWQRGRVQGGGGSEREGDVVLPRPPPQLPLPALCLVFPEAAAGSRREQLRCSAILCLPLPVPRFPAAAAEQTVSSSGVAPSWAGVAGRPRSPLRPAAQFPGAEAARAAGSRRGARRRLSRDAPGHFCPVRNWRRHGVLPCARLGSCVDSRGASNWAERGPVRS